MAEFINFKSMKKKVKFFKIGNYTFSSIEITHLIIAMLMIIMTIFVFNNKGNLSIDTLFSSETLFLLLMYAITIGLGFLLHELGHKLVAQYYGFVSEFRADFNMLALMFGLALILPIIFLAPGAVMILGRPTIKQNGIISVAGPIINLILAIIFYIFWILLTPVGFLGNLIYLGIFINAFLGVFNMLPIWVLDGKKVLAWNKPIYISVMGSLLLILILVW